VSIDGHARGVEEEQQRERKGVGLAACPRCPARTEAWWKDRLQRRDVRREREMAEDRQNTGV